ncbi:MAG: aryl-sulfate sulfotransferase, partial [Terracidiphilus sp.]
MRFGSLLGLFSLLFFAGCGFWVQGPLPIVVIPPPGGQPPSATQNGTITITPQYIALAPGQSFQFTATSSTGGAIAWFVNNVPGGNTTVGTVTSTGNYTAPASVSQVENIQVTAALASAPLQDNATAVVAIILPGTTLCPPLTGHPLVAVYTTYLPAPGKVSVEFGTTTNYGLNTWQQPSPGTTGGQVTLEVAGMRGNTTYHLRGQIVLNNGATYNDADFTCSTGTPPATSPIQITTPSGGTPQAGIEIWNTLFPHNYAEALATDLQGNVIWTYTYQGSQADLLQGIQLLPNGHFLTLISYLSSNETAGAQPGVINEIREIDLLGNTIRSLSMTQLNQKLAASSLRDGKGNVYQLGSFHHNVLALPSGHWILLATYTKTETIDVNGQVVTV